MRKAVSDGRPVGKGCLVKDEVRKVRRPVLSELLDSAAHKNPMEHLPSTDF